MSTKVELLADLKRKAEQVGLPLAAYAYLAGITEALSTEGFEVSDLEPLNPGLACEVRKRLLHRITVTPKRLELTILDSSKIVSNWGARTERDKSFKVLVEKIYSAEIKTPVSQ